MLVTQSLVAAFTLANIGQPDIQARWNNISFKAARLVPGSLVTVSLQRAGRLDALLRAMEAEHSYIHSEGPDGAMMMAADYQALLSEAWVSSLYGIVRAIRQRKEGPSGEAFDRLHHDLRLVRVPIEKYEIAEDVRLKQPLTLVHSPARDGDVPHLYEKSDPKRAHIMPMGVSDRGSMVWHATDLRSMETRSIERQGLSDAFLDTWGMS